MDIGKTDALDYYQQAIEIYQKLINEGQLQFRSGLAEAMINFGNCISDIYHPKNSLQFYQKAIDIYQDLISEGQLQFRSGLATAMSSVADINGIKEIEEEKIDTFNNLERHKYYQQAIDIYQDLIAEGKIQFRESLAITLANKGYFGKFDSIEELEDNLAFCQKAIEIFQTLITEGQFQFHGSVAHILGNMGDMIADFIYPSKALYYYQQAIQIYQSLINKKLFIFKSSLYRIIGKIVRIYITEGDNKAAVYMIDYALNFFDFNDIVSLYFLDTMGLIAEQIENLTTSSSSTFIKKLAEQVIFSVSKIPPLYLEQFYPLAEGAINCLLIAAMNRKIWDLALSLVGTARAQRLVKLAQADLLNRAAQADDPAELCKYREVYQRFAELEILLNVESGYDQGAFTIGRASNADKADQYATLHAEYTDLRRQLDSLQQALQRQGLLPDLGNDLFDGAALRNQLSQDKVLMILFDHGVGDNKKSTGVLLLTRESGQVLTINALPDLAEHLKRLTTKISSRGRGLRDGPQTREMVDDARMESGADLGSVDAETETLVQRLSEEFWKPIHDALGKMTKADGDHRRRWTFWKSTGQKPMNPQAGMVWLIPTGSLHGLPWQASAPPGLCCRVVPAPWFVREALNRLKSPIAIPTAENPLGILAYDAKTVIERQHGTEEKELFHLALEQTLIQAVWGEAVHPLTGLNASHPPAAFVVLAGHGANDADIPGAARVWVGRQDDGERRYVGFGDLWRTPLNLQSIYLSSCVVGMTREVNGEPMGLLSAGLLRGARYLVGWTVPVDDLGVALFSLLYHWAWREHQDPETALVVARQVFLSGDWPEETLALARQHLGVHIKGIMSRYLEIPASRTTTKRRLREVLEDLASLAAESAEPFIKILDQWRQLGIRSSIDELQLQAYHLADRLIVRRRELSFRYLAYFALGCG